MDGQRTDAGTRNSQVAEAWLSGSAHEEAAALEARIAADTARLEIARAASSTTHVHRGVALRVSQGCDYVIVEPTSDEFKGTLRYALTFEDADGWWARLRLHRQGPKSAGGGEPGAFAVPDAGPALAAAMDWVSNGEVPAAGPKP